MAGSPRKNRPGAVVISSPTDRTRWRVPRGTLEQTAATAITAKRHTGEQVSTASVSTATATTAKRHTRKRVSTAMSWCGGSHEGEMEAAQQQRGAADAANNNIGAIF